MADAAKPKVSNARETLETIIEMSRLLDTGLDAETLALCIRLCECGVNPEALSQVILELRKETAPATGISVSDSVGST
ncbi:mitotic-spindle organizing protein 1-like [Babylonia areolata]|uniref:mitotic-spindle organizing protein 1-like n=1 Tax=Babylonia areolata TaxID=304850 RepID=UPI003FD2518D